MSWDLQVFVVNTSIINLGFMRNLHYSTYFPDHFWTHWTQCTLIPMRLHWWSSSTVKTHPLVLPSFSNVKLLFNFVRSLPVVPGCSVYLKAFDETFSVCGFWKLGVSWKYRENFSVIYMLLLPSKNSSRFRRLRFLLQKSCLLFLNVLLLFMYSLILFFTRALADTTNMDIRLSDLWFLESPLDLFLKTDFLLVTFQSFDNRSNFQQKVTY